MADGFSGSQAVWGAFFHLEASAWAKMVGLFGSTTLAVFWPIFPFVATVSFIWCVRGSVAMKTHLKENLGIGLGVTVLCYAIVFIYANVIQIYDDHRNLQAVINGGNGTLSFAEQIASREAKLANKDARIDELQRELEQAQNAAIAAGAKTTAQSEEDRKRVDAARNTVLAIGGLIEEANTISANFVNTDDVTAIRTQYHFWEAKVEAMLKEKLDSSYLTQFRAAQGNGLMLVNHNVDGDAVYALLQGKIVELSSFIETLRNVH